MDPACYEEGDRGGEQDWAGLRELQEKWHLSSPRRMYCVSGLG
jgi:hypothetical protein